MKLEVQEFRKSACTLESELASLQRNESKQRDQLATTELKLKTAENELAEQNKKGNVNYKVGIKFVKLIHVYIFFLIMKQYQIL